MLDANHIPGPIASAQGSDPVHVEKGMRDYILNEYLGDVVVAALGHPCLTSRVSDCRKIVQELNTVGKSGSWP